MPDDVSVFRALIHAPDGSGAPIAALTMAHCGGLAEGEVTMKPIKAFGPPIMDVLGPMP